MNYFTIIKKTVVFVNYTNSNTILLVIKLYIVWFYFLIFIYYLPNFNLSFFSFFKASIFLEMNISLLYWSSVCFIHRTTVRSFFMNKNKMLVYSCFGSQFSNYLSLRYFHIWLYITPVPNFTNNFFHSLADILWGKRFSSEN